MIYRTRTPWIEKHPVLMALIGAALGWLAVVVLWVVLK